MISNTKPVADLEDLEASDVEDADKVLTLHLGIQSLIDTCYQPREHSAVQSLGQSRHRVHHLITRSVSLAQFPIFYIK